MVMIFEAKGCVAWCPKKTSRWRPHVHLQIDGRKDNDVIKMPCTTSVEKIGNIWIFRSYMKSTFQRIKRQGNRRFLQVDMAESLMVAHAEILDNKQCWSETAIAPSFGLQLWRMSTRWKGNSINFSIELYFGICSVLDVGVNPQRRVSNKAMTTR
jgi:hypothetical protein